MNKRYKKFLKKFHRHRKKLRHPKLVMAGIVIIAVGLALAGYFAVSGHHTAPISRLVTFHDRGQDHVILTHASTVRDALSDAAITVDPNDDVEPSIDSPLLSTDSAVLIYRARPVLVVDGALRQKITTPAQSPTEIIAAAGLAPIADIDKAMLSKGDIITEGVDTVLTVQRTAQTAVTKPDLFKPTALALSKGKGAQIYTDSGGVAHRETYYDLPMNIVIGACGGGGYTIRYDGAKVDSAGYVLVAANLGAYPRCSVVETSLGLGKVYDTGGFAARYPHGFDLATDWSNYDGR